MKKNLQNVEILKDSIRKKYGTIREYADILDISEENLHGKLKTQSSKFMKQLERDGIKTNIFSSQSGEITYLPTNEYWIIKEIDAGEPSVIYRAENIIGKIDLEYGKNENCFCLRVVGDSMAIPDGSGIYEGDIVLVDMDATIYNGDIVVASLENGKREMIKRYEKNGENIFLHSDNPKYKTINVVNTEQENFVIFRVVLVQPKPKRL